MTARLRQLGIDQTVWTTLLGRVISSLAGVVTVIAIARFLTPVQQGYYYTLSSLIGLQYVFELGFSSVILQLASHERASLEIRGSLIAGSPRAHARLSSILQLCVRHYALMVLAMAVCVLPFGMYFFRASQPSDSEWLLPWLAVVAGASMSFVLTPVYAFLEGCGFVLELAQVRLEQCLMSALLGCGCLILHYGLFAPAGVLVGQALWGGGWLVTQRRLLVSLWRHEWGSETVGWRTEIWPFQWRIAVTWLSGYFIFQLFNPILFAFQGPVVAGQMGMSLAVATSAGNIALAWITTKAAPFGVLVAKGELPELDTAFNYALKHSLALICLVSAGILMLDVLLGQWLPSFQQRFLSPVPFGLLVATTVLTHISFSQAVYLRAHKQESFFSISLVSAALVVLSTLVFSKYSSILYVVLSYFLTHGVLYAVASSYIFTQTRRRLHDGALHRVFARRTN